LKESTALSAYFYPNYISPLAVVAALDGAGVRAVLIGSHGLGGWRQRPRAEREASFLVAARNHRKAARALLAAFPRLRPRGADDRTTLQAPEDFVIALPKPIQPLLIAALVKTCAVRVSGRTFYVPTLEMALALVFAPMTGLPWSDPDTYMAAGDFLRILDANPMLDLKELAALGELVYNGGGADLLEKVRQVRAGERLRL
jgi:hypothetical protein